ncbi:hypothetical protein [Nitratireductor basaltis]|uniref:Uncharacterized protein n=1 Tax=Nitratireductor basaltis TaxID=472175 RepID=A0A084UBJ2_9HYPH|nr:hypothetical protein [Nitratireductor basaltis]KFB10328.1 hypothetical protein EL18_01359 [Nitratireductor basaltis]
MDFFTPDQIEALSATTVRCDLLVEMRFKSETFYMWNGNTELETGGKTYLPMYGYGSIDGLGASSNQASETVNFALNGIPDQVPDFLSKVLGETDEVDQRLVIVSLQLFDAEWQPVGSPAPLWWGFMQPPRVSRTEMQGVEGAVQTVSMTAENAFFNRSRPPYGRYTDRDQQKRYPGDKFFQYMAKLLHAVFTYPDY